MRGDLSTQEHRAAQRLPHSRRNSRRPPTICKSGPFYCPIAAPGQGRAIRKPRKSFGSSLLANADACPRARSRPLAARSTIRRSFAIVRGREDGLSEDIEDCASMVRTDSDGTIGAPPASIALNDEDSHEERNRYRFELAVLVFATLAETPTVTAFTTLTPAIAKISTCTGRRHRDRGAVKDCNKGWSTGRTDRASPCRTNRSGVLAKLPDRLRGAVGVTARSRKKAANENVRGFELRGRSRRLAPAGLGVRSGSGCRSSDRRPACGRCSRCIPCRPKARSKSSSSRWRGRRRRW
ncbi:hypothetical protein DFR50_14318 [Roseiarcus fermentans]|uniref:Uncharacterized protein n=1 Tax=Roseiarcus fermentans TaxID=1473586 RepID=A0A366EM68_9HYPH|nr:hypothetical protein DFR50_14318 [Roseiarcus fermentans]